MVENPLFEAALKNLDRRRDRFDELYYRDRVGGLRKVAERMQTGYRTMLAWVRSRHIRLLSREEACAARRRCGERVRREDADMIVSLRIRDRESCRKIASRMNRSVGYVHGILDDENLAGPLEKLPTWDDFRKRRREREGTPSGRG